MLRRAPGSGAANAEGRTEMGGIAARAVRAALMLFLVAVLSGCSSTLSGTARVATDAPDPDEANVALMDTGPYGTVPTHPFGTVGDDRIAQGNLEGQRMAQYVVGPWEIDSTLTKREGALHTAATGTIPTPDMMRLNDVASPGIVAVAAKYNLVTGFSSIRMDPLPNSPQPGLALKNVVMRFPDPVAAAAAAPEMAAALPAPLGAPPGRRIQFDRNPEAIATAFEVPATAYLPAAEVVGSFTAHGPYVLYQYVQSARGDLDFFRRNADVLAQACLDRQKRLIDQFVPTELSKLSELPLDPTGQLLAKTLNAPDNRVPWMIGAWNPRGWLHFEDDPLLSASLFTTAGVKTVSQRLTTVYEADSAAGAAEIVDRFSQEIGKPAAVRPFGGVPGLPNARCFEQRDGLPADAAISWQRIQWRYKCVARSDQYAFTAFSASPADVKEQIAAQYRILSGE
ncbi:hypothetical protein PDG61_20800 [Mycolicibacterium sp. BiH015]|uniref:DUF7373 family lipoprotein n=1 Tax=Mycolicibacterium sp. BiH015 TaxID=3018808 RepID=UPI0022E20AFE|nr:hypothetical protein [Mycolicibacterium sp. BiH015]MDA2893366.1 hypothetical protein [Mycolicibacterium sp. BiH015]